MVTTATNAREFRGKSTDEKPTTPALDKNDNGSVYFEMDTKKAFMWDGETLTWVPL
jgi:hypothetical protein